MGGNGHRVRSQKGQAMTPEPTWPRRTIRERYHTDSVFSHVVDSIRFAIEEGHFTPTEAREAAMLAQIMYEERHPRPIVFTRDDVLKGKV